MFARLFRRWSRPTPPPWLAQALEHRAAGRHAAAAALCQSVLAGEPDNIEALNFLAAALLALGRSAEGVAAMRRACSLAPGDAQAHLTLGNVLATVGDSGGALEQFQTAAVLAPRDPAPCVALAQLLRLLARHDEAEQACRQGLATAPAHGALLAVLYASLFEQGRVDEALVAARAALRLAPDNAAVHGDVLRMLNYTDGVHATAVWHEHAQWALRHAAPLAHDHPPPQPAADPHRRLRVGFVSPYFRRHAVTFFLESAIEHHDPDALEPWLYADVARPDDTSRRLQSYGARWRDTVGLSDAELAAQVRRDGIDVLVDLSGHTPGNRLLAFARNPAPVQLTWNGYPNTTGMRAIGYRITDACCDPPGTTEHLHAETLIRLPACYMAWRIPEDAPPVAAPPVLAHGHVTFGSFNACYKLSPTVIALWACLLQRVPGARLKLWTIDGEVARRRIRDLFANGGIDAGRIDFSGRVSHDAFLQAHHEVDIALDAYPYHGTTTTCFSLWMGTPVVTLAGTVHAARVGVSLLTHAGMAELVAQSPDQYCDIAVALAADPAALARRRATQREHLRGQPLTDGVAGARHFESAVRRMWQTYCSRQDGGS